MITPLSRLAKFFKKNKLDAVLISSHSNIVYFTNYSGFSKEEREAYLFITDNKQYILTDGRYSQAVKTLIADFKLIEISPKLSAMDVLKKLVKKHKIKKLGFEGHSINFLEHKKLSSHFNNLNHFSLTSLRSIKNKEEILKIKKACELGDKTFSYILKKIKEGRSEKELAFEIEFFIKKHGADISFPPIVASGKNSAIPHHQTSDQRLTTKDKFVLLDFGVKLNNYCSDMTRTVFFGSANAELKRIYQTVLDAQQKSIEKINILMSQSSNIPASQIDRAARDYIIAKGYKTIPHSVGHGIGIDIHETPHLSPKSRDILKEGMVFSIEPGIYLPAEASAKVGIPAGGVRIEDLVVLEKSGPRLLTRSPRELTMV